MVSSRNWEARLHYVAGSVFCFTASEIRFLETNQWSFSDSTAVYHIINNRSLQHSLFFSILKVRRKALKGYAGLTI